MMSSCPRRNTQPGHAHALASEKRGGETELMTPPSYTVSISRCPHRMHQIRQTCRGLQAVQYARDYLQPHAATHQAEIQRDMGTLLFPNPQESTVPEWVALFHDDR